MNEYELEHIRELKNRLSDVVTPEFTDFDFLRWLQGHDYNLEQIVPKLRFHFRFYRAYDFSKNYESYEILNKHWPSAVAGPTGKDNNFLYIEKIGTLDAEGILKCVPKTLVHLHRLYLTEEYILKPMRQRECDTGRQSGLIIVQDFGDCPVNAKQISLLMGPYRKLTEDFFYHYCEILKKHIVINVPSIFHVIFNMFSPILPQKTKAKFSVFGSNWKNYIFEFISPDVLPFYWGGPKMDDSHRKTGIYSKVPESSYWKLDENNNPDSFDRMTIPAGTVEFITLEVTSVPAYLEWSYYSDSDWGFGVFFTDNKNETDVESMEMVYPQFVHVFGETQVVEHDLILCAKAGYYKLWFSNSFSWFKKLQIRYQYKITSANS